MKGVSALALLATMVLGTSLAQAELSYTVTNAATAGSVTITLKLKANQDTTLFQMPNWAPGSYRYAFGANRVSNIAAKVNGQTAAVAVDEKGTLPKITTWAVKAPKGATVELSYQVPVQSSGVAFHYAGPSTYMYPVARLKEAVNLSFDMPKGTMIQTGLDATNREGTQYRADDYDVLADNPVTFGKFELDVYYVGKKPHYIAYRNAATKDVDREYVMKACKFITEMEGHFFGGLPYNKYVWHFAVNNGADGAGGLEHLSSTEISMASGVGPGVVSVYSHEFFHLWNVKRIRSAVLGPFDYTTLPQTGALWWLEGVTDYYAHSLLGRYGWYGKNERYKDSIQKLYGDVVDNVNSVRARQARMEVSPYESSFRVRDAANGIGNSQGYQVSYYNTGWLCGLVLDIELLDKTDGKKSLDDVELALWKQCKDNKPGFKEDEIRNQLIKAGGESLGAYYDRVVMKPGEIPVEDQLAKLGLELASIQESFASVPFGAFVNPETQRLRVTTSDVESLKQGDIIKSINGVSFETGEARDKSAKWRDLTRTAKIGSIWTVTVNRDGKELIELVEVKEGKRNTKRVIEKSDATAQQLKLRKVFLSKRK